MNKNRLFVGILTICITALPGAVLAAVISFSGQVDIRSDSGGARYSGVSLGQAFSGSFSYGTLAQASTDPSFPGDYDFGIPPFGGSITDGASPTSGSTGQSVQVSITDDTALDQSTADFVNDLLGTSLSSGSVVDIADIDTTYIKPSGTGEIVFGLSFIETNSGAWSGLSLSNFPPESGNSTPAIFFINETDAGGDTIFEAYGVLDSVSVVPLPAAAWLFVGGLGLLGLTTRRKPIKQTTVA